MKKTKEVFHTSVVRLMENVIDDIPVEKSGTYNRQDPTHWESGSKEFERIKHLKELKKTDPTSLTFMERNIVNIISKKEKKLKRKRI